MSESINVDESLLQRLPLPLVKLVRRAKRQDAAGPTPARVLSLGGGAQASGSVAVVEYAELAGHDPKLVEMLKNLARPAVGALVGVRPPARAGLGRCG